jgi:hypothetical protein
MLPKLDHDAFKAMTLLDVSSRNAELHHARVKELVHDLQALSEDLVQVFVEEREVNLKFLLAAIINVNPEQELHFLSRN